MVRSKEQRQNKDRISIDSFENTSSSINQVSNKPGVGLRGTLTTILTKQDSGHSMNSASPGKKLSARHLYSASSKNFGKMSYDGGTSNRQMN